jgi:predicted permease
MHRMLQDFRIALRTLAKSPVFALTAILILTLGIGAVTAVFSIVEAVLLKPLPFNDPGHLISLHEGIGHDAHELRMSAPDLLFLQRENRAFSGVSGFIASAYEITGAGEPFQAHAERVTASLFPVLGVEPFLGRTFTQNDDDNATPVAVISYTFWKRRFQSDPKILGRTMNLDRRPYVIIGVMPSDFEFPLDAGRLNHRDLWIPMSFTPVEKSSGGKSFDYGALARLKPGVTMEQAQKDVDQVIAAIQAQYPVDRMQLRGYFFPLKDEIVRKARPLLRVLLGAAGLILLIACVNLINMLLVRAAGRRREFATRLALGAAWHALLRQLLAESLLLSFFGGAGGTALAIVLVRMAIVTFDDSLPRAAQIGVNWGMLLTAIVLIGITGFICGLVPMFEIGRRNLFKGLGVGNHTSGPGLLQHRFQSSLVILEVALAMVLLVASGLLLRSFAKMLEVDPGFEPSHVLTASLSLPANVYQTQQKIDQFFAELQRKLDALPSVKAAGFSSNIPIVGQNSGRLISPEGYVSAPGEDLVIASNYSVQGNYFQALGIPLIRGRYFSESDEQAGAPLVTVVGQSLASTYFKGKNPVGMHIKIGPSFSSPMPEITIIGVVGDIKQAAPDQPTSPQMYVPLSQAAAQLGPYSSMLGLLSTMNVVLRTSGDPGPVIPALNDAVRRLDPLLPVNQTYTMDEVVAAAQSPRRFNTLSMLSFAMVALLLCSLGIYGTMSYFVLERTRHIAIRMALGATPVKVVLLTMKNAFILGVTGAFAGLLASTGLTRLLSNLLYGVKPFDSIAVAIALAVLLACSLAASSLPAWRAASVDPSQVLRGE